jgi:hypothetical protein
LEDNEDDDDEEDADEDEVEEDFVGEARCWKAARKPFADAAVAYPARSERSRWQDAVSAARAGAASTSP